MKTSTWAKRLKRLMTEAEMPFYPDAPQVTQSVPVSVDVEVLKSLLNWAVGSSPEDIDRALLKVQDLAASGAIIDSNSISEITAAGDYQMPNMGVTPPVESPMAPVTAPVEPVAMDAPPEGDFGGASDISPTTSEPFVSDEPIEEPIEPEIGDVEGEEGLEEPIDDESLDVPAVGEEEEDFEENVKNTFFKSFFS